MDDKGRHQALAMSNNCIVYMLKSGATSEDMQHLFDMANEKGANVKIPVMIKNIPLILIKKEETQNIYVLLKSETVLMSPEDLEESIEQNEKASKEENDIMKKFATQRKSNKPVEGTRAIRQRPCVYIGEKEKCLDPETAIVRKQNENKCIYRGVTNKKPAFYRKNRRNHGYME